MLPVACSWPITRSGIHPGPDPCGQAMGCIAPLGCPSHRVEGGVASPFRSGMWAWQDQPAPLSRLKYCSLFCYLNLHVLFLIPSTIRNVLNKGDDAPECLE